MSELSIELKDARFIVSSMHTQVNEHDSPSEEIDKNEKEQLMEKISAMEDQEDLFLRSAPSVSVDEDDQIRKLEYHDANIKDWLGMDIPEEIKTKITLIDTECEQDEVIDDLFSTKIPRSCVVCMSKEQYSYISKNDGLESEFCPPVSKSIKPDDVVQIKLYEDDTKKETKDDSDKGNQLPEWFVEERDPKGNMSQNAFVVSLNNDILKLNAEYDFKEYLPAARHFLTDVCCVGKSLTREQVLVTYLILQKKHFRKSFLVNA